MPLIINELEVNVTPDAAQAPARKESRPSSPAGLTPQHVHALVEKDRARRERLRAH